MSNVHEQLLVAFYHVQFLEQYLAHSRQLVDVIVLFHTTKGNSASGEAWPGHRVGMDVPAVPELSPPPAPLCSSHPTTLLRGCEWDRPGSGDVAQDKMGSAK